MSDATALTLPDFKPGTGTRSRHVTLVPASGLQIHLLVPAMISVNKVTNLPSSAPIHPLESDFVADFDSLVEKWRADTLYLSGANIELHPAYRRIMSMGDRVLPLILADMQRSGGHWFRALEAITGANPAQNASTVTEGIAAWLAWGRLRNLV